MGEIASQGQLRMSYLRWAAVTVPAILMLGFLSGRVSNSGYENRWFSTLDLPSFMPPGWAFGAAWTLLYILLGVAVAMILNARGARGRGVALGLFFAQLLLNFCWSPLFFGAHQVSLALGLILLIFVLAIATFRAFLPIRRTAALLLLPYIAWLAFASLLNFSIDQRNPDAETLVPPPASAQIRL